MFVCVCTAKMKTAALQLLGGRCGCGSTYTALHLFAPLRSTKALSTTTTTTTTTRLLFSSTSSSEKFQKVMRNNPPGLIDIDCNLLHKDLISILLSDDDGENEKEDPLAILRHPSTKESGIVGVLSPSSTLEESVQSVDLVSSNVVNTENNRVQVLTTVGIHPYHAAEVPVDSENISLMKDLIAKGKGRGVVCVGECGLDYSEGFPESDLQMPWFEAQLNIAFELNMPLFFHERFAFKDFIKAVDQAQSRYPDISCPPSVVHCFTGTKDECKAYIERGFYIGLTGFLNKGKIEGAIEIQKILEDGIIPLERLMIETDAPYLGFDSCRDSFFQAEGDRFSSLPSKKRKKLLKSTYPNVPSSLPLVLSSVTHYLNRGRGSRGESLLTENEVACACTINAANFFGFKI